MAWVIGLGADTKKMRGSNHKNAPTESAKSNEETTEYPEFEVQEWIAEQEDNLGRKKSFKSNKIK